MMVLLNYVDFLIVKSSIIASYRNLNLYNLFFNINLLIQSKKIIFYNRSNIGIFIYYIYLFLL